MKKQLIFILFILSYLIIPVTVAYSADQQTTTYDKEQMKQDYRAFLQQLKVLNAQYKEITGEISKVVKEEGMPTWDGGTGLDLGETTKNEDKETSEDLGGGVYLKQTERDMQYSIELPGYKKDSIKLTFQGTNKLAVHATKKVENISKSYDRTFDLPAQGDQKGISASFQDGVLTVKVPKVASKEVFIPVK